MQIEEPIATVADLTYSYPEGDRPALRELNWAVAAGEFVTVTGPSGSGKSTLLRCLNGLTPHFSGGPFEGMVPVFGLDTRDSAHESWPVSLGSSSRIRRRSSSPAGSMTRSPSAWSNWVCRR